MARTNEELADLFKGTKETIDNAYYETQNKYGSTQANIAMYLFFKDSIVDRFTRSNDARANMRELTYRFNEIYQILAEYAISSFLLNNLKCDMSLKTLTAYATDSEGKLDYSGMIPIKVMALASAYNNYWATNFTAVNPKLKEELISSFIAERYGNDKRNDLDNTKNSTVIHFTDHKAPIFMSKTRLINDIRNMNVDSEMDDYIPPTRKQSTSKK